MYFLRKNVSWTGKIEKRREELDSIGIGPTRSAQILSKEFGTNITKDTQPENRETIPAALLTVH